MSNSIINIENVNKWFGDFQVLKNINLEVQQKVEPTANKESSADLPVEEPVSDNDENVEE